MNLFHVWASVAMPSNLEGSRNRMLISYLASWVFTPSILAGLRCSWSSNRCMLTAACDTAFFNIHSSRSLTCSISFSSSWYLSYRCFRNNSCSGSTSNLFSTEVWHRLYLESTLLQYSTHAPFVFFTVFLNSSTTLIANSSNSYSYFKICWSFTASSAGDSLFVYA